MDKRIVEVDVAELAVRLIEAMLECGRPDGKTAKDALATIGEENRDVFTRGAVAAVQYFQDIVDDAVRMM